MSVSYSGIVGRGGTLTLPSVDSGLGSMNILRDPPKSIMTRRRDRVGMTSSITEMQDMAADRVCENISVYARGVNPMVSVSYSNNGNGNMSGGIRSGGQTHAFLPYTIMKDGAFRPPIVSPEQLMPLSRQPRGNTQAFTQPGYADFSKKLMCPGSSYGTKDTLKACIRPTATFRIETPLVEPFEVKYVIQNPIKVSAYSGRKTIGMAQQYVGAPSKEIFNNPLHANANVNSGSNNYTKNVDTSNLNTERYTQETLHSNVNVNSGSNAHTRSVDTSNIDTKRYTQETLKGNMNSNVSNNIHITPLEDIMDINIKTKDLMNISYTAPISGNTKENFMHSDPELKRRVVATSAFTNKMQNIYSRPQVQHTKTQKLNRPMTSAFSNHGTAGRQSGIDLNNRNYRLNPTISAGSFTGRGQMPMAERNENMYNQSFDTDQTRMNKKVMSMHENRYLN